LVGVFVAAACVGAAYVALAMFHQPYALSLGAERVSSFFVGFTAAALTMRLGFGTLGDRLGRGRVAVGSMLIYVLVTLSMLRFDTSRLWLHGAGFGIAHGIAYPTLIAFATEDTPTSAKGRVIASFSGSFSAGTALGASLFGALSTRYGYPAIYVAATGGLLLAAVMLGRASTAERTPRLAP
jgi:MFS family permease